MTNILIVDDVFDNHDAIREILEDYGITSTAAECIDDAVQAATNHDFDLVLMDMTIPRKRFGVAIQLGGIEATLEIRSRLGDQSPPFIAVTAQGMPDLQPKIFAAGIAQIVEKSVDLDYRIISALQSELGIQLAKTPSLQLAAMAGDMHSETPEPTAGVIDSEQPTSLDSNNQNPVVSEVKQAATKPVSNWELRCEVRKHLDALSLLLEEVASEARETERNTEYCQSLRSLRKKVNAVMLRLGDHQDGPSTGETYGHWIVNMLIGVARGCVKLQEREHHEYFDKFSDVFAEMNQHIQQSIAISKSDLGQQRATATSPSNQSICNDVAVSLAAVSANSSDRVGANTESLQCDPPPLKPQTNLSNDGLETIPSFSNEPSKRLVLIVDDESEPRRDLEEKLKRLNYRVVSCDRSSTAIMFLDSQRFDVCLIDLAMPEINGLELIDRIRRSHSSANASIIVVSGSSESFAAAEAIEAGADDYLEKPANERLLKARIQSCLRQTDARLSELSKFLPLDVAQRVLSNRELLDKPVPADISVMVCDIRGFSGISERIGPVRTIDWISDVMNRLSRIILHRGGTIIDYVGDEIMAMWGAPIPSQSHADDACNCAVAIQLAVDQLSEKWFPIIGTNIGMGIGINSGLAVVGNTGSTHRMKYGPLGNTVNLASRVQGATKYLQSSILITEDTASRINSDLKGRRICAVRVMNINEPVKLYELATCVQERSGTRGTMYRSALEAFENENLGEAIKILAALITETPNDGPAKLLMMRVIQSQLGGSFDPVWTLPGK